MTTERASVSTADRTDVASANTAALQAVPYHALSSIFLPRSARLRLYCLPTATIPASSGPLQRYSAS